MTNDWLDWFIEDMMEKASVEIPGSSPFSFSQINCLL